MDHLDVFHGAMQGFFIADVRPDGFAIRQIQLRIIAVNLREQIIENDDRMSIAVQLHGEVTADEAGAACN